VFAVLHKIRSFKNVNIFIKVRKPQNFLHLLKQKIEVHKNVLMFSVVSGNTSKKLANYNDFTNQNVKYTLTAVKENNAGCTVRNSLEDSGNK
jgi:hypothetical protein